VVESFCGTPAQRVELRDFQVPMPTSSVRQLCLLTIVLLTGEKNFIWGPGKVVSTTVYLQHPCQKETRDLFQTDF
jgi:hypothetical protein